MSATTIGRGRHPGDPGDPDAEATLEKALGLLRRATDDGGRLGVFPETFVPLYPSNT